MSDFSLFSLFTAGLACLVPLAHAYTQPVGAEPSGNPIYTPGLNDVVPVGEPYTITWQPTTQGTVTLVLLKGPADNLQVVGPLVEGTMNTGSYVWVPSDTLAPGDTGYGIQLIVDSNGQYQYTTQFGISNPDYQAGGSSASPSGYATEPSSTSATSVWSSGYAAPTGAWPHSGNGTAHPTGGWGGHHNATQPKPTGHHTKPTWHTTKAPVAQSTTYVSSPTTTAPAPPKATGGAATVATSFFGLVAAAGIAVFAL